jgi:hypothetical protein
MTEPVIRAANAEVDERETDDDEALIGIGTLDENDDDQSKLEKKASAVE